MEIELPEESGLADLVLGQIEALDPMQKTSVFTALGTWCEPPPLASEIDGILNHTYDVYVLTPDEGAPDIVIVHKPGQDYGVLAGLFRPAPDRHWAALPAARAVGTTVEDYFRPEEE